MVIRFIKRFLKLFYIAFFILALFSSKASAVPTWVHKIDITSEEDKPNGFTFNNDGTKMFITGHSEDEIFEYTLSTAWNVKTASYVDSFSTKSEDGDGRDVKFNQDGTKMFVLGKSNDRVCEYTLSTGFDVSSTVTFIDCFSVADQEDEPDDLQFSPDGTKMFVIGCEAASDDESYINEYTLRTDCDVYNSSLEDNFSVNSK